MSVYDQLMARFKRPNKTSLTRQEAVAPTPGQAASNLSAPPLSNGKAPAATIPASSVRAGRRAVDVNKAKDPDRVKENMGLINGGASNTTDETTPGAGSVKPTSHSVEVHDAKAPKYDSYDRMLEFLQANQVADADADARARRREMFASIGDGISAISSLYQTTKGAPVTYTPGADMSKVMRDRYDRMIAQRKADSDKYLNYLKVQADKERAERQAKRDEFTVKYQEGQMKKWENEARAQQEKYDLQRYKLDIDSKYKDGLLDIKKEELEIKRQESEGRISHWQATERLQELNMRLKESQFRASQQPTTSHTVRTDKNGDYAGESTTVRTKGVVGGSKKSGGTGNSKKSTTTNKKPTSTKRKTGGGGGTYSGFSIHKK